MKVSLCQINTTVGDFDGNLKKVLDFIKKSKSQNADLIVFPELCISSYPPLDLLDRPAFLEKNEKILRMLCESVLETPVIVGSIIKNLNSTGRAIQNAALVIQNKKIIHVQAKRLLPTYDVFDEFRYFEAAQKSSVWNSPWGPIGFCVCEDSWFEELHQGRSIYHQDPAQDLKGVKLVINISASPFELNKHKKRYEMLQGFVRKTGAPLVYVNQVGANDEILFDGSSLVFSEKGEVIVEMPSFKEELSVIDVFESSTHQKYLEKNEIELLYRGLITGIKDYFYKTGFRKAVLGLSGGIDSSVVACLACQSLGPENVLGMCIPSQFTSSQSLKDAQDLAQNLGIEYRVHSLKFIFSALLLELKSAFGNAPQDVTEENIQARLRATMLMALANKRKALLLTTGNKSELAVGYCTTYGDMAGALAPLGDVYKTKVYMLAHYINSLAGSSLIPDSILTKPPTAELRASQTDEESLGPYAQLDSLLEAYIEGLKDEEGLIKLGFEESYIRKILNLVHQAEFKRYQAAPVLKVTSKAFGLGRRVLIGAARGALDGAAAK